jgi:hypothetical protein
MAALLWSGERSSTTAAAIATYASGVELAALLELLYSARDRSRTVRATVRRRSEEAVLREALRRRGLYREPPRIPPEEGDWGTAPDRVQTTTRLWAARPDWLRWETEAVVDGEPVVADVGVKQGGLYWMRDPTGGVHTNEGEEWGSATTASEEPLLDPASLLGAFRFELGEETEGVGRPAVRVRARRRAGDHTHALGHFADELELVVDRERGLLLRVSARLDGVEIERHEVVELALDEPLDPQLFRPLREGP